VGHRNTGTQLESVSLHVSPYFPNLYSRWDTGTQVHNSNQFYCKSLHTFLIYIQGGTQRHKSNQFYCMSLHNFLISIQGGTQYRDTGTQLETVLLYVSPYILNLYSRCMGHRDTVTQLESVSLYVSPYILNLYMRWDTGTQGHRDTTQIIFFCLSLHNFLITIQGGTQGHRDTTRISSTVCHVFP
jgi:hypothetical protein